MSSSLDSLDLEDAERRWAESALLALLGLAPPPPGGRDVLFAGWRTFLERLAAARGPVTLALDDLHDASPDLLDFLDHVVRWAQDSPDLVGLSRPSSSTAGPPGVRSGLRRRSCASRRSTRTRSAASSPSSCQVSPSPLRTPWWSAPTGYPSMPSRRFGCWPARVFSSATMVAGGRHPSSSGSRSRTPSASSSPRASTLPARRTARFSRMPPSSASASTRPPSPR